MLSCGGRDQIGHVFCRPQVFVSTQLYATKVMQNRIQEL